MKRFISGLLLGLCWTYAVAGFVDAEYQIPGGGSLVQSKVTLTADARGGGDSQTFSPLGLPFDGNGAVSYIGDAASADIAASFLLTEYSLQISITRLFRDGKAGAGIDGRQIFTVSEQVLASASGIFSSVPSSDYSTENYFSGALYDYTSGQTLFESIQSDNALNADYHLGGLTGNRKASFIGNLENILEPGHFYGFRYTLEVGNPECCAGPSSALGNFSLTARPLPEPSSLALILSALVFPLIKSRRSIAPLS